MPATSFSKDDNGVHRLKDILVEEVSLVDHAANKRRFLLVKRDGNMDELRSNGRGGFTRVAKAETSPEEDAEKAGKPFPGAAKPFGAGGKKPEEEDPEEKKKRVFDNEEESKRKAAAKADATAIAEQVENLGTELMKLAQELEGSDDMEEKHKSVLMSAHKKMGAMVDKTCKAVGSLEKRGAKMAAARLEAFQKAMETLQSLLSELMETPAKAGEHQPDAGDPQKPAAGWSASNPSQVPSGDAGTAGGWTGGKAALQELTKMVGNLTNVTKSQATEIARLKKGIPGGNSQPVQGNAATREDLLVWPLDMNRPIERGTVCKNESFYDAD